jgi:hypothetical protein
VTDPAGLAHIHYRARVFSVRRLPTLLVVLLGLVKLCACSQLLDTQIRQCQSNEECTRFGDALCDLETQVCVPRPPSVKLDAQAPAVPADAGADAMVASCQGRNGCFSCPPTIDTNFFNTCTDSRCVPFDNRRLRNLDTDGTLKALP